MEKPSEDEELDFLSPKFDPLKVLTTSPSKLELPCPDVQPCDNLQMYNAGINACPVCQLITRQGHTSSILIFLSTLVHCCAV